MEDDEEEEEIVGSLLSSLENILLRGTNISADKMRNQSEKDNLLSRHTSLASETFESAGRRGYLSGHLTKLGHVYKTWRRRFFILNDAKRLLFYYDDAKTGNVKGVIELAGADVLRDVTRGKELCFQISYPRHPHKRRFLLYAENQRDLQLWLKALNHVAQHDGSAAPRPTPVSPPPRLDSRLPRAASSGGRKGRLRNSRSTSLSPLTPAASQPDPMRRTRSVSATSTTATATATSPSSPSSSSLSSSASELPSPPPSPRVPGSPLSPGWSSPPSLLSALSASSTALPEALSSLQLLLEAPDSPGSRRASLPILPSQHQPVRTATTTTAAAPTPIAVHLRSFLTTLSSATSRSWTLLPFAPAAATPTPAAAAAESSTSTSTSTSASASPPALEALAGPSEQRGAAAAAMEDGSVEQQQTIGRCMTSIAVHVDAGLRTPSVELAHEEDNDDEHRQEQQEPTECAAHDVLPGSPPRPSCPSPRPGPGGIAGAPEPEENEHHHQEEGSSPPVGSPVAVPEPPVPHPNDDGDGGDGEGDGRHEESDEKLELAGERGTEEEEDQEEDDADVDDKGSTIEDWTARFQWLIEENRAKVLAQVEPHGAETAGWTLVKEEGNVLVSRKEMRGESCLIMTRAEGRIRASASRVLRLIASFEYDPLVLSCERVKKLTAGVDIAHLRTRSPFPFVSNRDFVLLRSTHRDTETGTYLSCATSIPELPSSALPLAPGAEEFVRGEVLNSGWAVEPFDEADDSAYSTRDETDEMEESGGGGGGGTREEVYCTYVVCVDLRGLVPSWVVNRFQARDVHAAFARLKQQAEDHHRATTTATPPPPPPPQQQMP